MTGNDRCECTCGKMIARRDADGALVFVCKGCKREWTVESLIAEIDARKARRAAQEERRTQPQQAKKVPEGLDKPP